MAEYVTWIDRDRHIYQITLPESLETLEIRGEFLDEVFAFIMGGPDDQFVLVDMTRFNGRLVGLTDPKLLRQRNTEFKTRAVAILTSSASAMIVANTVRAIFHATLPWRFFKDRDEAEGFLRAESEKGKAES